MKFGDLVDVFESSYLPNLAVPTQYKYGSLLRCHVKPALSPLPIEEVNTRRIDEWLASKSRDGLAWATRADLRNLVCSIFTRAENWDLYEGKNPALRASPGRKKAVYEKRKLTVEQTKDLLAGLRDDVRIVCMVALFCGLRISEVMGLCWRHVDLERGMFLVRQRYYRGDVDRTKTDASMRDVPFGYFGPLLAALHPGPEGMERFCFEVKTLFGATRCECSIRRYFLRPAAEKLGIYYPGFGFRAFRREAVTEISSRAGAIQACRVAGHSRMDITLLYGLNDYAKQDEAIRSIQEPFKNLGLLAATGSKQGGKV
jgi:integrase